MRRFFALAIFLNCIVCSLAQAQVLPYKNPALPIATRVKDLLSRMTPEEKFWQLFMIPGDLDNRKPDQYKNGIFGLQVSAATATDGNAQQLLKYNTTETAAALAEKINRIQRFFVEETRLGIPIIPFDEALHGLVRKNATAFPQSIALAATFDTAVMHKVSAAIAVESRLRGIRDILSPVINIATDVRWGRTEETYGEDPYLSSLMVVAYVHELEKAGIITTPKHFLANVGDGGRDSYPIHWNERLLREIHLPPFEAAIKAGGARSVMTSYNSLDGTPATANSWLLQDLLKKQWGFTGFVISDAGAVGGANVLHMTAADYPEASKRAMNGGLDVIFQTAYEHEKLFSPPFYNDSISRERIDDAVSRVLRAKFELGLFEDPYVKVDTAAATRIRPLHHAVAYEAALKAAVLLKNERQALPIPMKAKRILVVGEDAAAGRLGGYSGPGIEVVSLLEGLKRTAPKGTVISYEKGVSRVPQNWKPVPEAYLRTVDGRERGIEASYYSSVDLTGKVVMHALESQLEHHWTLFGPEKIGRNHFYSVEWNGQLVGPVTGTVQLALEGNDGYRLYIDDVLKIDRWSKESFHLSSVQLTLQKGRRYRIRIQFHETTGNAHIRLLWNYGIENADESGIRKALAAAASADYIIVGAGIHEGEFQDRAYLNLPGRQEELIRRLAATGKPVVVVLSGGSAITMDSWLDKAAAVLYGWYPGEAGGEALADLIFGKASPSGKLPITFPKHEAQLPLVYNHKPTGRGDDYHNLSGEPLFPFGFGLSYSSFRYDKLELDKKSGKPGDSFMVSCTLTNTGRFTGEEVVQLYIRDELASVARPVQELKGFQRIRLLPGQSGTVQFRITPEQLEMYDAQLHRVIEPGDFRIMVGSSSREIRLFETLTINTQ